MTADWDTLVQAEALAAALPDDDLVLVDCRWSLADPQAGAIAHGQGHVPGAVHADLDRDLSGPAFPGAGRHPWPRAEALRARLGSWGVSPQRQVVAYDAGDGAFAARLWCLLQALGHRRAAVLDGGWARWTALGLARERVIPEPAAADYPDADFAAIALFDPARVAVHLSAGGVLVDARAGERFRGEREPLDRVAGHVPGAVNRPYAENLDADGRFKPAQRLRAEFEALLGGRPAQDVVAMCGSGVTACHHLLAMRIAGLSGAGLFTGSWSGWIEDPARPVATG